MNSMIEMVIESRPRDLGGFEVRRVLPAGRRRQRVGPFIFFDHMGPADFAPGSGIDVRPHPHIGLATVTYLFEGEILHRDSLGCVQAIAPGAVNWMTAGRGIVHSERSAPQVRARGGRLHGIQSWVALPAEDEEMAPAFDHYPAADLPAIDHDGVRLRLIAGTAFGKRSPVAVRSPMFYLDAAFGPGTRLELPDEHPERAVYPVDQTVTVAGTRCAPGGRAVLAPGATVAIEAPEGGRVMVLGGAPLPGERHIWWNFVSSSSARIERAKSDWAQGRFPPVPDDDEFIPLPPA
ncbi:MAG: pirin family protein [Candidatus Competibacterales bacterium]|nr:pirin family protein [Candidatus Competibacterales bacterium]